MKKSYLIGYDLNKSGQDYTILIDEIEKIGTWWHCLDSTFIIKTNSTAVEIRDHLKKHIDPHWSSFVNVLWCLIASSAYLNCLVNRSVCNAVNDKKLYFALGQLLVLCSCRP